MSLRLAGRRAGADASVVAGIAVAAAALALYARTMMPGLGLWDTAEFQAIGPVLGIAHPTGYPTYTLLAWLASVVLQPFGDEAVRANLLSALLAAASVGLTAGLVSRLTGNAIIGAASGIALAVAPTTWSVGLRADAHALHLLLAAVLLGLLVGWAHRARAGAGAGAGDRWLIGAAAVYGLSLGNHALTLLLAPGIGLFVLMTRPRILWQRPLLAGACVLALAATTIALYMYLPLRSAMDPPLDYANPQTLEGFRYIVLGEQFRGAFTGLPPLAEAGAAMAGETFRQLGPLAVLAVVGIFDAARRRPALLTMLALWFVLTWVFALGYINADIERYHLVPTMSVAVLGGLGAAAVWRALVGRAERLGLDRRARAAVAALVTAAVVVPVLATVPLRFDAIDLSGDTAGRDWADALFERVERDAVIVSWWSFSTPLWYAQFVEGARPDVWIVDDRTILDEDLDSAEDVVEEHLGRRPVYLVRQDHEIAQLRERFVLEPLDGIPLSPVYVVRDRR